MSAFFKSRNPATGKYRRGTKGLYFGGSNVGTAGLALPRHAFRRAHADTCCCSCCMQNGTAYDAYKSTQTANCTFYPSDKMPKAVLISFSGVTRCADVTCISNHDLFPNESTSITIPDLNSLTICATLDPAFTGAPGDDYPYRYHLSTTTYNLTTYSDESCVTIDDPTTQINPWIFLFSPAGIVGSAGLSVSTITLGGAPIYLFSGAIPCFRCTAQSVIPNTNPHVCTADQIYSGLTVLPYYNTGYGGCAIVTPIGSC